MAILRPAILLFMLLTVLTGGLYPLATTLLGQWWFPEQASGSLIHQRGEVRGSLLLGQAFSQPGYFQGRPSATADAAYNPMASGGSNLAGSNPALDHAVAERVAALRQANPHARGPVPVELVTASASGLDPHISPAAARWQLARVAAARQLPEATLVRLIDRYTSTPVPAFMGQTVVNVLQLNLALDALQTGS